jgi:hypothetical protein
MDHEDEATRSEVFDPECDARQIQLPDPEDENTAIIQTVGNILPVHTTIHSTRIEFTLCRMFAMN